MIAHTGRSRCETSSIKKTQRMVRACARYCASAFNQDGLLDVTIPGYDPNRFRP